MLTVSLIGEMSDYVPFVLKEEESLICREIEGKALSLMVHQELAIVLHFVNNFGIKQRLVKMQILAKYQEKKL